MKSNYPFNTCIAIILIVLSLFVRNPWRLGSQSNEADGCPDSPPYKPTSRELNFARTGIKLTKSGGLEIFPIIIKDNNIRIQLKWMNYIKEEHNSTNGVNSS